MTQLFFIWITQVYFNQFQTLYKFITHLWIFINNLINPFDSTLSFTYNIWLF